MYRLTLPLLFLLIFAVSGCASHSSRHTNATARIEPCRMFPCGSEVIYPNMVINYEIQREPSGECILTGTAMPRGVSQDAKIDIAIISIELARDITISDSFSFPMIGKDLSKPLKFKKRFTPNGGFDGITFHWDIRYLD